MALDSFPNTAHNNREISLAENEQLWAGTPSGLIGYTGVTPAYGDSTGRQVKVRALTAGRIRGTKFNDTAGTTVAMTTNTSGSPRVDLLVARLDRPAAPDAYIVTYVVIAGVPAASPVAPQPVRTESLDGSGTWDIPIAEIRVANGYTTVAASDVTNRAWWISPSGFHGFDAAKPPAEGGALFRANDTGITYLGTPGGSWQRLYYNTGWQALTISVSGWSALTFHFARSGDLVVMTARLQRTGSDLDASADSTFGTLDTTFRPGMTIWDSYHCSKTPHSAHCYVTAAGTITFAGTSTTGQEIKTDAILYANMTWLAAE